MNDFAGKNATVVMVHAAWADGSSWSRVLPLLRANGLRVTSAQLPLTSITDDAVALDRLLARVEGPVILAAHSYGGAVITKAAAGNAKVRALVYIAAMAPAAGETVGALLHRAPAHPEAPHLAPDTNGQIWMSEEGYANAVAHRSPREETDTMAATQKPISVHCLGEPMTTPAWSALPSWFLLAEDDRMIAPSTQRFMAERAGSRIASYWVDHTPLASAPELVAELIKEAALATL